MRLRNFFAIAFLLTFLLSLHACKGRSGNANLRSNDRGDTLSWQAQCQRILTDNKGRADLSEYPLYLGLFSALEKVAVPLSEDQYALFEALWGDFSHSIVVFGRQTGISDDIYTSNNEAIRNLFRAYVGFLGEARAHGAAVNQETRQMLYGNNTLGQHTQTLLQANFDFYPRRLAESVESLQKNRGITYEHLLFVYMLHRFPDYFGWSKASEILSLNLKTPQTILESKTTPALACNNHAASVAEEPARWDDLGMDGYHGFGYISWFHEPIAQFITDYPGVAHAIPVFGSLISAGDQLLTLWEGKDVAGQNVGSAQASILFFVHYAQAVLDVYALKGVTAQSKNLATKISQRIQGKTPSIKTIQDIQASLKNEAMIFESSLTPFQGRTNLTPCLVEDGRLPGWQRIWHHLKFFETAYAAGGWPCFKNLKNANVLHSNISNTERLKVIQDIKIADTISAPGHQYLRDPQKVISLAEHVAKTGGAGFEAEPIVLNIFTDSVNGSVAVRSVEVLDGNHRFAAGLLSGKWQTIRDVPSKYLKILVNGWEAGGNHSSPRWIPLEIAQKSSIKRSEWFEVPTSWGAKGPTAQIPGHIASIDDVFPEAYRGVRMQQVLKTSLERIHAAVPEWLR